ncbi:MAG: hypothetical protein RLP15_09535 [Cryomorphaceae bacterium]
MARTLHITLAGADEGALMLLAKYLTDNAEIAKATVVHSTAETIKAIKANRSAILVIMEDEAMELDITSVLEATSNRRDLKVIALLQSTAKDQRVLLEKAGVDRIVDVSQPNQYEVVHSIVQEVEESRLDAQFSSASGLTGFAWIGLLALLMLMLLAVYLAVS